MEEVFEPPMRLRIKSYAYHEDYGGMMMRRHENGGKANDSGS